MFVYLVHVNLYIDISTNTKAFPKISVIFGGPSFPTGSCWFSFRFLEVSSVFSNNVKRRGNLMQIVGLLTGPMSVYASFKNDSRISPSSSPSLYITGIQDLVTLILCAFKALIVK